jgi:hypothetical protein
VAGNQTLTALASATPLVLIAAQLVTATDVRALMPAHVFTGLTLAGPPTVVSGRPPGIGVGLDESALLRRQAGMA